MTQCFPTPFFPSLYIFLWKLLFFAFRYWCSSGALYILFVGIFSYFPSFHGLPLREPSGGLRPTHRTEKKYDWMSASRCLLALLSQNTQYSVTSFQILFLSYFPISMNGILILLVVWSQPEIKISSITSLLYQITRFFHLKYFFFQFPLALPGTGHHSTLPLLLDFLPSVPLKLHSCRPPVHFHTQPDWSFHDANLIIPLSTEGLPFPFLLSQNALASDKILQKSHIFPPHISYSMLQTYSFSGPSLTIAFSRKSFLTIVGWIKNPYTVFP